MRISDWSSDVCSSDLAFFDRLPHEARSFTTALPAFDAFPMALWSRHVAKYWRAHRDVVLGYGDTQGHMKLRRAIRSEEHTSELQSLMRISYAVFCLKKKTQKKQKYNARFDHKETNNRQEET